MAVCRNNILMVLVWEKALGTGAGHHVSITLGLVAVNQLIH